MMQRNIFAQTSLLSLRLVSVCLLAAASCAAQAQGFFGGIKLTDTNRDQLLVAADTPVSNGFGIKIAKNYLTPEWERARNPFLTEQNAIFGGVRFGGLGLGAAMTQVRPTLDSGSTGLSKGLSYQHTLPVLNSLNNPGNVNLDVYSSWTMANRVTFFSRLGYERNEVRPLQSLEANMIAPIGSRALRNGQSLNYGLGVRYEITDSLGLRAEFTRGTRFGLERSDFLRDSEPDSVTVGVRLRF
jgi:opacity protein-like surface antigen